MQKQIKWTFWKHLILSLIITCVSMLSEFAAFMIINSFSLQVRLDVINKLNTFRNLDSIGIIGGADGPTSIFISGGVDPLVLIIILHQTILLAILLILYIPIAFYLKKVANKNVTA